MGETSPVSIRLGALFLLAGVLTAACAPVNEVEVAGVVVSAHPYELRRGVDPDRVFTTEAESTWAPKPGLLNAQIPVPWPPKYLEQYQQPFAPWTYQKNAAQLCAYAKAHPSEASAVADIADRLFRRMLHHTVERHEARFVTYSFNMTYEDHPVAAGWTSGLGNGSAITGTIALHRCWPRTEYVKIAHELALAYRVLRASVADGGPWFSFVTDDGYLWFEEYPLEGEPAQPMVLNGHITALTGLYYLWDHTGGENSGLEELIRAGIASVDRYISDYRRIGQRNCYDLTPPCHDDYGPARTVAQQNVLYVLTGDESFREMRDYFAEDMNVDVRDYLLPEQVVEDHP
jgi:hypothetical protein